MLLKKSFLKQVLNCYNVLQQVKIYYKKLQTIRHGGYSGSCSIKRYDGSQYVVGPEVQ